ncbi:hypothetical protein P3T18_006490 [Paraburkholderia sp. GAS199]|uniref:hypothetical protein n=1 Tax=Paraburkholderia sp. GAS199 TaxID=3035126 RepID=UPI003D19B0D1
MVVTYVEDSQQLIMKMVESVKLAPLLAGCMEVPFFVDDQEFEFDDEAARQFGVAMLNVIAEGRPEVKKRLNVTRHPIDEPPEG